MVYTVQPALQYTGTYTVNPDCTGTMTITNQSLASAASSFQTIGNVTTGTQTFTVNFVELGMASSTLNPSFPQLPELDLTVSGSNLVGSGYAIAQ